MDIARDSRSVTDLASASPIATAGVLPRLYLGLIFSVAAFGKIAAPAGFAKSLGGFLNAVALTQGFGWYQDVVRTVILPRVELFAVLVTVGEIFVAITMLLGIFTRAGAAVAIVLLLNYLCAKGMPLWAPASNDAADIVLAITVAWTNAGRAFGIDGLWKRDARPPSGSRSTA